MVVGAFAEEGLGSLWELSAGSAGRVIYGPEKIKIIVNAIRDQAEGNLKGLVMATDV